MKCAWCGSKSTVDSRQSTVPESTGDGVDGVELLKALRRSSAGGKFPAVDSGQSTVDCRLSTAAEPL